MQLTYSIASCTLCICTCILQIDLMPVYSEVSMHAPQKTTSSLIRPPCEKFSRFATRSSSKTALCSRVKCGCEGGTNLTLMDKIPMTGNIGLGVAYFHGLRRSVKNVQRNTAASRSPTDIEPMSLS